jgi:DNA-directed RNA polymerase specialized sigma24 family protein
MGVLMRAGTRRAVFRPIDQLFRTGTAVGLSDAQLLERFVVCHDEAAESAFAVLMERHGPMVLGVCRRVLNDPHAAQDAFQATFLVLVRKAGSIRKRESIADWLYGVALRVSAHARADAARRPISSFS